MRFTPEKTVVRVVAESAAAGVLTDDVPPPASRRRFPIDHGTNNTPPPRQINMRQMGTAYIWHSTTQELLPILPPDHPDYETNANMVMAAIRRWNGETK